MPGPCEMCDGVSDSSNDEDDDDWPLGGKRNADENCFGEDFNVWSL